MLGNFFMLTCPYLFDLETLAYFALLRNYHSTYATRPITETTQLFLDVYTHGEQIYVHPLKVQYRHSSTMYMLHAWNGDVFRPVTDSVTNAEVLRSERWAGLEAAPYRLGTWNRAFIEAEEIWREHEEGTVDPQQLEKSLQKILRMMISREDRVLELAGKYLTLGELLRIRRRMIGTGLIGGKSVGMLLARAILRRQDPTWDETLEPQDSFFIGSDVFYTYLVVNGCWTIRRKQRDPEDYLEGAEGARQLILRGHFPENIREQLSNMLDYFGQSPLIVRSSSLLEDNFGNAFAGKYESVFCANQGAR
jgi:pyruvate, water dikinase